MTVLAGGVDPENVEVRAGVVLEEEAREPLTLFARRERAARKNLCLLEFKTCPLREKRELVRAAKA